MKTLGRVRYPAVLALSASVVGVDQLTKWWAVEHLADGHADHVIWSLQFNLAFNRGMAFGAAEGLGPLIGVVATIVVVVLLISLGNQSTRLTRLATGLVIGGAAGNVADRLFRGDGILHGSVVDFIDFQWFPIFNVADIAINVGGGLLILGYVLAGRRADG